MRGPVALVIVLAACGGKHDEAPPAGPASKAVLPAYAEVAADAAAGAPADAPIDANPLLAVFGAGTRGPSTDEMVAKMRAQETTATAEEKVLIEKMIAALRELDLAATEPAKERAHQVAGMKMMLDAVRGTLDHARVKGDVATQRTMISSYAMTSYQIENMGIGDAFDVAAIRRDALERGRALAAAFPKDARAWKLLGWLESAFADDHGSSLAAMRAYQTCAKLDPAITECPQLLAKYRDAWREPYCEAADIEPGIGWWEEGAAAPRFTSKDVVRLQAKVIHITGGNVYDATTGQVIDKAPDRDDAVVIVELAPAAVKQEVGWEREVRARGHYFELRVGTKMVVTAKGSDAEPEERVAWSAHGVAIGDMCRAVKQRALPADLGS